MRRGNEVAAQRLVHVLVHTVVFGVENVPSWAAREVGEACKIIRRHFSILDGGSKQLRIRTKDKFTPSPVIHSFHLYNPMRINEALEVFLHPGTPESNRRRRRTRDKLTINPQNSLFLVFRAGFELVDDLQAVVLGHLGHLQVI